MAALVIGDEQKGMVVAVGITIIMEKVHGGVESETSLKEE